MNYGIEYQGVHSHDDLGWSLVGRTETPPKVKPVKVEVPYSNGSLDYTGVYGECFYTERVITYSFKHEFDTMRECMDGMRDFAEWLDGICNAEFHDSMFSEFHFTGTCTDVATEHAVTGVVARVEATFECYPFMVADDISEYSAIVGTNHVINDGRAVRLTVEPLGAWSEVTIGDAKVRLTSKQVTSLCLESGLNEVEVDGSSCILYWYEERM